MTDTDVAGLRRQIADVAKQVSQVAKQVATTAIDVELIKAHASETRDLARATNGRVGKAEDEIIAIKVEQATRLEMAHDHDEGDARKAGFRLSRVQTVWIALGAIAGVLTIAADVALRIVQHH
jgi:hypothetical protein